jgi:hypothetical protein
MLALGLGVGPAHAEGPTLHEYLPPDEAEDVALNTTTASGVLPSALDTPSGVVRAPDVATPVDPRASVYGNGTALSTGPEAHYRIDSDTSRPDTIGYDDPFTPALTPFKRLYAYDAVDAAFDLVVTDRRLVPLPVGGPGASVGDDPFYANLVVDLQPGAAVRIPSVGPGARVVSAATLPAVEFELLRDGADNWFVRAGERQRVRLVMQVVIARAVFGSEFADESFADLARRAPALPPEVHSEVSAVIDQIGIARALSPSATVAALVGYFRSFAPSAERPTSSGALLYRDLVRSRKGVCRHRSYAFMITALALGIPTRFVRNEAHAWVEVHDGRSWHRIDLGGAAGQFDVPRDTQRAPHHIPPADPYQWPDGSESGLLVGSHTLGSQAPEAPDPDPAASAELLGSASPAPADPISPSELVLEEIGPEASRGAPLEIKGRVTADGEDCSGARVDVVLRSARGHAFPLGSMATDTDGTFRGTLGIPIDLAVGDYQIELQSPGTLRCGPAQLR